MATKVLEVHLVGDGVSLDRAFAGSAKSASAAANTIEAAGTRINATGKRITAVGKTWNRTLTLPLLALGGAAVASSFKFERSMSLISTQAGGTRKEVDQLEKKVLSLAKSTHWSPDQLAEGLFHIESAGYRSSKAMDVLNASQKLSTVGNSDLEETTYALVSAVKSLGVEGLAPTMKVAAEMNAIVGSGDMHMEDFAASLSSGIIPAMKGLGGGLRDVGAAMDVLTARGTPAQASATKLRTALQQIAAPSKAGADALKKIGMGATDFAETLRHKNLGAAVLELKKHLEGLSKTQQQVVLKDIFGSKGASLFQTLLQNAGELNEKYKDIGAGAKNYNREVKEAEEQPLIKMETAWNKIKVALVEIGKSVGPPVLEIFEGIAGTVGGVTHVFSGLDAGSQKFIVSAGLAVAAVGPLLTIGGKLVSTYGKLFEITGAIAASNVAGDLSAALSLAMRGEMGGLTMVGGEMAKTMMRGVATKLGPLAAAAGLADIVYHATQGDWKSVGFEAGGALVGGIAGFMLGGPAGAALGVGLGAFGGDLANSLFGGLFGGDTQSKLQQSVIASSKRVAAAFSSEQSARGALTQGEESYHRAVGRTKKALHAVEAAEKKLAELRAEGHGKNSIAIIEAEGKIAGKRHDAARATREEIQEEETLRFLREAQGQSAAEVVHATSVAIPTERQHIHHLHNRIQKEGYTAELGEKMSSAGKQLAKYLREQNDAYKLLEKSEPAHAKRLKEQTYLQQRYGEQGHTLVKRLHELHEEEKQATVPTKFGVAPSQSAHVGNIQQEIKHTEKLLDKLHRTTAAPVRSSGILGHVQRDLSRELHEIKGQFDHATPDWARATTKAMHNAIGQIRAGMHKGVIETGKGKQDIAKLLAEIHLVKGNDPLKLARGFRDSWIKAGAVNVSNIAKMEHQLGLMPRGAQEAAAKAMLGMARSLQQKGKLPEAQVQNLRAALQNMISKGFQGTARPINIYKQNQEKSGTATEKATAKLHKFGNAATDASQKVQHAKTEVVSGFSGMEAKGTSFLQALKVQSPFTAPTKASGGYMVKGHGLHDTVPVMQQDVAAMVAPGEMLAVINRHQAPLLSQAVSNEYGVNGLGGFFDTFNKPHYMATGGLMEPKIGSGGSFRKGEQKEVHQGFKALNKYLQEHSEPKRVHAMLKFAEREAHQGFPYVFGGGHGGFTGPYDCSGYVSAILHAGNFLSAPMSTQQGSGLNTLGEAGPGKWFTWGVRGSSGANAHTMMSIKKPGNQGWGYFESGGSGGGAHEDSGWDGSFEFRHMPGYARGGIVPNPVKKALRQYGTEATDPRSPHFVGWGFNRGGIARTFSTGGVPHFSTGGPVPPKTGETVGASYYGGPTDHVSGTTGAAGVSLPGTSSFAELAMGTALGGLAMHTKLEFSRAGKSIVAEKLDVGGGGDPVSGHNRAVDFWYEAGAQLGIGPSNGVGLVKVKPADGSAVTGTKKAEVVPGVFHGAKTHSLNFPSVPKNLPAIKREIDRWQGEAAKYRQAIKLAKGKPKTEHALQANLTKIENYLRQLYTARTHVRFEKAKKKLHGRIARQLGKLTGKEEEIEKLERAYDEADETATQTVDLEPQAPRTIEASNPDDANEVKRVEEENKRNEEAYVQRYQEYVDHQERSAYERVLSIEGSWRNKIIEAERFATGLELHWETEARTARIRVEGINRYTDQVGKYIDKVQGDINTWQHNHPKKSSKEYPDWLKKETKERDLMIEIRDRERTKLPMLRERDRSFSAVLGEGREHFYGAQWIGSAKDFQPPGEPAYSGTGSPLNPPSPPMSGSGSLEDSLVNVQGSHWPDQHSFIETLPSMRQAGRFGGVIWDTQTAVAELDLKMSEVAGQGGGGGGGGGNSSTAADELASEKLALTEEALQRERQARSSLEATAATMGSIGQIGPKDLKATFPWAGRYAKGGPVAALFGENGPEIGVVPEGTNVANAAKTESLLKPEIHVINHIHGDEVDTEVLWNGEKLDAIVETVKERLGQSTNHLAQNVSTGKLGTFHG